MAVPSYQELMLPALSILAEQGTMKTAECADRVATKLGLSEEDRLEMLPSGSQRLVVNRTGWAAWYMMQAGLVSRPRSYPITCFSPSEAPAESHGHKDSIYLN